MPGKNPTIKSLKIGDILSFGAYSAAGSGDHPVPITWIKASTNCDFVSEFVLDYLVFDEAEEWGPDYRPDGVPFSVGSYGNSGGDPNYIKSNIFQFLNSMNAAGRWFRPSHDKDRAPIRGPASPYGYADHDGFLRHFKDFERRAMVGIPVSTPRGDVCGLVQLMSGEDVYGDNKLPLFRKRRGIRAMPSRDLSHCRPLIPSDHYVTYVLRSKYSEQFYPGCVSTVGTDAYDHPCHPQFEIGIRPIIRLDPDARIAQTLDDVWEVVSRRQRAKYSGEIPGDALSLLGLV